MVQWKCNGCREYNSKLFGEKRCRSCGLRMGHYPKEEPLLAREPLPPSQHHALPSSFTTGGTVPSVASAKVEAPVLPVIADGRCLLGAHVCMHCETAFLVKNEKEKGEKHERVDRDDEPVVKKKGGAV